MPGRHERLAAPTRRGACWLALPSCVAAASRSKHGLQQAWEGRVGQMMVPLGLTALLKSTVWSVSAGPFCAAHAPPALHWPCGERPQQVSITSLASSSSLSWLYFRQPLDCRAPWCTCNLPCALPLRGPCRAICAVLSMTRCACCPGAVPGCRLDAPHGPLLPL